MDDDERLLKEIEKAAAQQASQDDLLDALVRARGKARPAYQEALKAQLLKQVQANVRRSSSPALTPSNHALRIARAALSVVVVGLVILLIVLILNWVRRDKSDIVLAPPITSVPASVTSPIPTATSSLYYIAYFTAEPGLIDLGSCITLSYWIVGAQEVMLENSEHPGSPEPITDNPNQRLICPPGDLKAGATLTYTLIVTYLDGTTESREAEVIVR